MSLISKESDSLPLVISFEVLKMMLLKVSGQFHQISGEIHFDKNRLNASFFDIKVDVSSIDSKNRKRDEHLKGEDFFDIESHRFIEFKSNKMVKSLEGFYAVGELKIKDVIKTIDINFFESNDTALSGSLQLNRKDYKLGDKIPNFIVGNKIAIEFSLRQ
ncbi:MAG: YceI family protein [Bacteroidota bacterium]